MEGKQEKKLLPSVSPVELVFKLFFILPFTFDRSKTQVIFSRSLLTYSVICSVIYILVAASTVGNLLLNTPSGSSFAAINYTTAILYFNDALVATLSLMTFKHQRRILQELHDIGRYISLHMNPSRKQRWNRKWFVISTMTSMSITSSLVLSIYIFGEPYISIGLIWGTVVSYKLFVFANILLQRLEIYFIFVECEILLKDSGNFETSFELYVNATKIIAEMNRIYWPKMFILSFVAVLVANLIRKQAESLVITVSDIMTNTSTRTINRLGRGYDCNDAMVSTVLPLDIKWHREQLVAGQRLRTAITSLPLEFSAGLFQVSSSLIIEIPGIVITILMFLLQILIDYDGGSWDYCLDSAEYKPGVTTELLNESVTFSSTTDF